MRDFHQSVLLGSALARLRYRAAGGGIVRRRAQEIVVVREVLEGMLAPDLAQSLLFAALDSIQVEPRGRDGWLAFAEGPLYREIDRKVGAHLATEVLDQLTAILGRPTPPPQRDSSTTNEYDRREGPTRVLVVASQPHLARSLKGALGPMVSAMSLAEPESLLDVIQAVGPAILLVDLTDELTMSSAILRAGVIVLPPKSIVLLWDEGTEAGETLRTELRGCGRPVAWVDRREGVQPLLDHIRAAQPQ